jgi:hypothetical protein
MINVNSKIYDSQNKNQTLPIDNNLIHYQQTNALTKHVGFSDMAPGSQLINLTNYKQ